MQQLKYSHETLNSTLQLLAQGGEGARECVVLWLGKRSNQDIQVTEVYLPEQKANVDFFHIPPASMQQLLHYLKQHRLMVAAQVHTHPGMAFHSEADDKWAFVRHQGAISIVLPCFAKHTTALNYLQEAEFYCLSKHNTWDHIQGTELFERCQNIT